MATLLQIAQLGSPVIRETAKPVTIIKSKKTQRLIDDLIATVMDANGVGIAAPQVYQPLRLFIVASHPSPRYPNAPHMKPTAIINPAVISHSKEQVKDWEGCLSIPGIRGFVPRYTSVLISYTTRQGDKRQHLFTGFPARIVQHEYDHLDGIVFLDRIESTRDIITEKEFQRLISKKP